MPQQSTHTAALPPAPRANGQAPPKPVESPRSPYVKLAEIDSAYAVIESHLSFMLEGPFYDAKRPRMTAILNEVGKLRHETAGIVVTRMTGYEAAQLKKLVEPAAAPTPGATQS